MFRGLGMTKNGRLNVSKPTKHFKSEFQERSIQKNGTKRSRDGHEPNSVEYFDVRNNFDEIDI